MDNYLSMNETQYGIHLSNMKTVKDDITFVNNIDVLNGNNCSDAIDKFVSIYEDIRYVMRRYKWLLENDIEALESIKTTWVSVDNDTASRFSN